jgi:N-acetylglucosaminyldiphosphoundecaprenol N-acetyl-beta-D-mannosaminyltransferase
MNKQIHNPKHKQTLTFYQLGTIAFHAAEQSKLIQLLRSWLEDPYRQGKLIGYINPHVYNQACQNIFVKKFLRHCDLVCIDGFGISISARLFFGLQLNRVIATHLFEAILDTQDIKGNAILIGTTEEEVNIAMKAINKRSRGLYVIAAYHGFHDMDKYKHILVQHNDIDAILVGMGTPKSEQFLLRAQHICQRAICWHIGGGTIRIYAGTKHRAPAWVSKIGCEWIHRYLFEPEVRSRYVSGGFEFAKHIIGSFMTTKEKV